LVGWLILEFIDLLNKNRIGICKVKTYQFLSQTP
jgi:hypothetical protein